MRPPTGAGGFFQIVCSPELQVAYFCYPVRYGRLSCGWPAWVIPVAFAGGIPDVTNLALRAYFAFILLYVVSIYVSNSSDPPSIPDISVVCYLVLCCTLFTQKGVCRVICYVRLSVCVVRWSQADQCVYDDFLVDMSVLSSLVNHWFRIVWRLSRPPR